MQRSCHVCGRDFEAKRKDAITCSATCRSRKRNVVPPSDPSDNSLVKATRTELEAAGKVDTMLGQLALTLAARLRTEMTGASTLSKELRAVVAEACGTTATGAAAVVDDVDELRARRDAKRVG